MAMNYDIDPEALKQQQQDQSDQKRMMALVGGIGDTLASGQSFGNFYSGKMNPRSTAAGDTAKALSDTLIDPVAQQQKLYQLAREGRQAKTADLEGEAADANFDPESNTSMAKKALAAKYGIQTTPDMHGSAVDKLMASQRDAQGVKGSQNTLDASDPNSRQSQDFRASLKATFPQIVAAYGDNFENVSAADKDLIFDPLKLKETIDARKAQTSLARDTKATDKQNAAYNHTVTLLEQLRGSPAAAQAEKDIYAADKAKTLMKQFAGNPNPAMAKLFVMEIGKIAQGGSPTMHELDALTPNALSSKLASAWEKLSGNPTPAGVQDFLKQYNTYAQGISEDARKVVKDRYGRIVESTKSQYSPEHYQTLKNQYVNRFDNEAGPTMGSGDADKEAIAWATQNPKDPRAQQILALHGVSDPSNVAAEAPPADKPWRKGER